MRCLAEEATPHARSASTTWPPHQPEAAPAPLVPGPPPGGPSGGPSRGPPPGGKISRPGARGRARAPGRPGAPPGGPRADPGKRPHPRGVEEKYSMEMGVSGGAPGGPPGGPRDGPGGKKCTFFWVFNNSPIRDRKIPPENRDRNRPGTETGPGTAPRTAPARGDPPLATPR